MLLLTPSVSGLFKWRQFEPEVILLAVGWYLRFSLSYREVEELLAERGLSVDHVTVWRWVQRYAPEIQRRLRTRLRPTNDSWRAPGSIRLMPFFLALKAEALHLSNRTSEALEAIREAEALGERSEERCWSAELHRLRGVFLAAIGSDEVQIEASFHNAIRIAKEQKSVSLAKRAEATYVEYRKQKASAAGGRGFRLPLW